ncbi:family 20 glycosylhydrolase [Flavilitoribacter nigricans]|uniref:Glycoside hydrolase n=1 Tax=Flavilitoribacter nigricans (strain ATCC 23147 / DSM 23189 / NBRC 102662 / NCIMB 1420 / SS-2) TaxID=1122177 RepID=A0A2D0N3R2_FLAN2|nr:family 20 glycosylhydrolase [Flavilitoribacter nigricans]PHN03028.1 glycoside hydrolase [Flavilitoribacter nigricans DSM 23189 = NBRC 102662]
MKRYPLTLLFHLFILTLIQAQPTTQDSLPLRGFCIGAPGADGVERFVKFIREELAPRGINTLILRIDYNYQYTSRPELANPNGLSKADVTSMLEACREHGISMVPQVNLLGHQSWHGSLGKLLQEYPEFDETPEVELPENYEWPNEDGLYCKSYCPLHPDVHEVVFDIVDEICEVFQSDAFHAGMDEVFYIGHEQCPRCNGRDKAELFAGEVTRIRNHLHQQDRQLWIWGDRLIDGKTTGIGLWEGSYNNTHRAVDLIPKDVLICDWHYERPDQAAVYFAMKGLPVVTCPWRNPEVAKVQMADMYRFRESATPVMKDRFRGILQTIWSGSDAFLDQYYGLRAHKNENGLSQVDCFQAIFPKEAEMKK